MKLKQKTSEIFFIVIVILISLLVITIYERHIISIVSNKKNKINILYYSKVTSYLTKSKVVLNVALFTIVIILVNPIRLLNIFNPYIFNLFGSQYSDLLKYIHNFKKCDINSINKYIKNKPEIAKSFDKNISEVIFNKNYNSIYNRIINDFKKIYPGKPLTFVENEVCSLAYSIEIDNALQKDIETVDDFIEYNEFLKKADIYDQSDGNKEAITKLENFLKHRKNLSRVDNLLRNIYNNEDNNKNNYHYLRLDESRSNKFIAFNKIIEGSYNKFSSKDNIMSVPQVVLLITIYLAVDYISLFINILPFANRLRYELYNSDADEGYKTTLEKAFIKVSEDNYKIRTSKVDGLNIYFLATNIFVIFLITQLFNNNDWLSVTGLDVSYTKRYIMLVLFLCNAIPKLYYKFSTYISLDDFLLVNILSITSNAYMLSFLVKYMGATSNRELLKQENSKNNFKIITELFKNPFAHSSNSIVHLFILLMFAVNDYYIRHYYYKNHFGFENSIRMFTSYFFLGSLYMISILIQEYKNMTKTTMILSGFTIFVSAMVALLKGTTDKYHDPSTIGEGEQSFKSNNMLLKIIKIFIEPTNYIMSTFIRTDNDNILLIKVLINIIIFGSFGAMALNVTTSTDIWSLIEVKELRNVFDWTLGWIMVTLIIIRSICINFGVIKQNEAWNNVQLFSVIGIAILIPMLCKFKFPFLLFTRNSDDITFDMENSSIMRAFEELNKNKLIYLIVIALSFNIYNWLKFYIIGYAAGMPGDLRNEEINNILYVVMPIKILLIIILIISQIGEKPNVIDRYTGGAIKNKNNSVYLLAIVLGGLVIYNIKQNYQKDKNKLDKLKGGESQEDYIEANPLQKTNISIINIIILIVIVLISYGTGLFYTKSLTEFINNKFLSYTNINKIRLLLFPFIVIVLFFILFGFKVIKTFVVRSIEKGAVYNIEKNNSKNELTQTEKKLLQKYSNKSIDKKKNEVISFGAFLGLKYFCIIGIIIWYCYIIFVKGVVELDLMLFLNLSVLAIYVYFIQYAVYIFYKIYINENVNKIQEEIKTINKIKAQIKFRKGKVNPVELEEIIEINTSKLKIQFEEFMNELYDSIHNILTINNIFLTSAIELYMKRTLIKNKKLEDEFNVLKSIEENRKIELAKRKKLGNKEPLKPIPVNPINNLKLSGKWSNIKDNNNIILHTYNNIGIVLEFNEKKYQSFKIMDIVKKSNIYEFIYNNNLQFIYDTGSKNIIINDIPYTQLSSDFSTENIIKKTLQDTDVFKSLNYMITLDEDSKYIGKYNIVDNLVKYNKYKKEGDRLAPILEQMIMNKILLIKSIKNKKYKEADMYNKKVEKIEKLYKKPETFYKFDSNRDGVIDINEIDMYTTRNHKLSNPGKVKVVSAIYDGGDIRIKFDKPVDNEHIHGHTITNIDTATNKILLNDANKYYNDNDMVIFENMTGATLNTTTIPGTNKIYLVKTPDINGFMISKFMYNNEENSGSVNNTVEPATISISFSTNNKIKVTKLSSIIKIFSATNINVNSGNYNILDVSDVSRGDFVRYSHNISSVIDNRNLYEIAEVNPTDNTIKLTGTQNDSYTTTSSSGLPDNSYFTIYKKEHKYKFSTANKDVVSGNFNIGDTGNVNKGDFVRYSHDIQGSINSKNLYEIYDKTDNTIRLKELDSNTHIDYNSTSSSGLPDGSYFIIHKKGINVTIKNDKKLNNNAKYGIIDNDILKITLTAEEKEKIDKSSNNKIIINSISNLKNKEVKLYKTVNNFAEFDPAIFDP